MHLYNKKIYVCLFVCIFSIQFYTRDSSIINLEKDIIKKSENAVDGGEGPLAYR